MVGWFDPDTAERRFSEAREPDGTSVATRSRWEHECLYPHPQGTLGARARVGLPERHQADLIYVNAWDHLITLARIDDAGMAFGSSPDTYYINDSHDCGQKTA